MPENALRKAVRQLVEDLSSSMIEERVIQYVIREVHLGRRLAAVLQDNYVKNRLDDDKLGEVLEKPEVIEAVEGELTEAFKLHDFKFTEE